MVAKKKKAPDYEPIGDYISTGTSLVQASMALDLAAEWAQEVKNPDAMIQVAALWIEIGNSLNSERVNNEDEEGEEVDIETTDIPTVGFGPPTPKEIAANDDKG